MKDELKPRHYAFMSQTYPDYIAAVEALGKTVAESGPLDEKTLRLVQLAGAATAHSEGSVISHAKRAMAAGASLDEVYHALMSLTSTIGFPTVAASINWVRKNVDAD